MIKTLEMGLVSVLIILTFQTSYFGFRKDVSIEIRITNDSKTTLFIQELLPNHNVFIEAKNDGKTVQPNKFEFDERGQICYFKLLSGNSKSTLLNLRDFNYSDISSLDSVMVELNFSRILESQETTQNMISNLTFNLDDIEDN